MRKILQLFLISVMFVEAVLTASGRERGYYEIKRGAVLYNGAVVREADPLSFKELGYGYGKDRSHVFMNGNVLPYVDPAGFRVDGRYAAPEWPSAPQRPGRPGHGSAGQGGQGMRPPLVHKPEGPGRPDGCPGDFSGIHYVVTRFEVLFDGRVVDGAVAHSFKDLGWMYGKDAFNIWWGGQKVRGASVSSFSVLRDGYAVDAFSVWYCGKEMKGVMPGNFRTLGNGYAEDGFCTYYYGKKIR